MILPFDAHNYLVSPFKQNTVHMFRISISSTNIKKQIHCLGSRCQAAEFMFGQSPVQRQVLHQDVYQHLIEMISSWQSGWDLWKTPTFEQGISCQSFYICYCWSNIDHNTHDKDNKDKEDSHDEDADNDRAPLDLHCSIFQWLIHHQLSRQEIRATNRMHLHAGQEHAADMSCEMGTSIMICESNGNL